MTLVIVETVLELTETPGLDSLFAISSTGVGQTSAHLSHPGGVEVQAG